MHIYLSLIPYNFKLSFFLKFPCSKCANQPTRPSKIITCVNARGRANSWNSKCEFFRLISLQNPSGNTFSFCTKLRTQHRIKNPLRTREMKTFTFDLRFFVMETENDSKIIIWKGQKGCRLDSQFRLISLNF